MRETNWVTKTFLYTMSFLLCKQEKNNHNIIKANLAISDGYLRIRARSVFRLFHVIEKSLKIKNQDKNPTHDKPIHLPNLPFGAEVKERTFYGIRRSRRNLANYHSRISCNHRRVQTISLLHSISSRTRFIPQSIRHIIEIFKDISCGFKTTRLSILFIFGLYYKISIRTGCFAVAVNVICVNCKLKCRMFITKSDKICIFFCRRILVNGNYTGFKPIENKSKKIASNHVRCIIPNTDDSKRLFSSKIGRMEVNLGGSLPNYIGIITIMNCILHFFYLILTLLK
nr:MAG TPA: hypothetical protein [Caudoviricetes sp.]